MKFTISTLLVGLFCLMSVQASAQVFYSEDFGSEDAFNAWTKGGTNDGAEDWFWSDDPTIATFGAQPAFGATTAANGFAVFNSDANGNAAHDVTITSPAIDCSSQSSVFIRVENQYGYFSQGGVSITQIGVSTDGTNFTYYDILTDVEANDLSDAVQVSAFEIPEAANQATVYLQFRWQGFYEYAWKIDDISLEGSDPTPLNDLVIEQAAIAANYAMPITQVDTVEFINIIRNAGLDAQTNVLTTVDIVGDNGVSFSTSSTAIGSVDPATQDTTAFTETFVPDQLGLYTMTYTVSQDEDEQTAGDNSQVSEFIISDGLFAKDNGIPASATQPASFAGQTWQMGNYYIIQNDGYIAGEVSFSVASNDDTHKGQQVSIFLNRIVDNNDGTFDDMDIETVGFAQYTFEDTDENFDLFTVDILDVNTFEPGVELTAGEYLVMVEYTQDMFCPYSDVTYYWDISTVVRDGDWFLGGFGPETTAIIRMSSSEPVNTEDDIQLLEAAVKVSPNPASTFVDVNITLEEVSETTFITIRDAQGKEVIRKEINNLLQENVRFDVSELPAGSYLVHIQTAAGFRAERLLIQK